MKIRFRRYKFSYNIFPYFKVASFVVTCNSSIFKIIFKAASIPTFNSKKYPITNQFIFNAAIYSITKNSLFKEDPFNTNLAIPIPITPPPYPYILPVF